MKRRFLLVAAGATALTLGVSVFNTATAQEEEPVEPPRIVLFNPSVCVALDSSVALACTGTGTHSQVRTIANAFGDDDDVIEPEDFAPLDITLNQLHQNDPVSGTTGLRAIIFLEDDDPVEVEVDDGILSLLPAGNPDGSTYLCDGVDDAFAGIDSDCDADGVQGDGVIFVGLFGNGDPLGTSRMVVQQGEEEIIKEFTIVGEPDEVEFLSLETTAQTGVAPDECELATSAADVLAANATPERSVVLAIVRDSEGTAISGAWVHWESDDEDKAVLAQQETPTIDLGSFGVGAPNILCGTEEPGVVTITGTITRQLTPPNPALIVDPEAEIDDATVEWTIRGEPASIVLTASPETLACDGAATSTVTANVTDADGDPVANGQEVHFDVKVLGTTNPIDATTTDGAATTVVTPLAIQDTGVPVVVTSGDAQASILVQCTGAVPTGPTPGAPAPAPTAPGGVISGPDTGSGGSLAGRASMSVWPAVALLVAGLALAGMRFGVRRL